MNRSLSSRRQSGFTLLEVLLLGAAMLMGWRYIATTRPGAAR
ncbi:MAG: type II secretion system protein [Aeromonas sobria]